LHADLIKPQLCVVAKGLRGVGKGEGQQVT
jgi:hypothetical protein